MTSINLACNSLTNASTRLFGNPEFLQNLTELNLSSNRISDAGCAEISRSPELRNLVLLDLLDNPIGDAGARALAQGHLKKLKSLRFGGSSVTYPRHDDLRLTDEGVGAIAKSRVLENLESLKIISHTIGDHAAEALAQGTLENLLDLAFWGEEMSPAGVEAIAKSRGAGRAGGESIHDQAAGQSRGGRRSNRQFSGTLDIAAGDR